MKYTIVVLLATTEKWLRLSRQERRNFSAEVIEPIIFKYSKSLTVRMFDAEAFSAKTTDFLLIETNNLNDYYFFWEEVRDSKIYTEPYFIINEIIVGNEGGYKEFEKTLEDLSEK